MIIENETRIENRILLEVQQWQRKLQEAVDAKDQEKNLEMDQLKRRIQDLEAAQH
jgi:hypothetical protein